MSDTLRMFLAGLFIGSACASIGTGHIATAVLAGVCGLVLALGIKS